MTAENTTLPALSAVQRAYAWAMTHKKAATLLFAVVLAAIVGLASLVHPQSAYAIAPLVIIGAVALVGATVAWGADAATGAISDWLRDAANTALSSGASLINSVTQSSMLTTSFKELYPDVYDIVYNLHQSVAIPLGNVVLLIFFVVGLCKILSKMGQTEAGVDMWSLVMVFIGYAAALFIIDSSWELMMFAYELVRQAIVAVLASTGVDAVIEVQGIPDDVSGIGWLLMALLVCGVVWLIDAAVALLSQIVVMVRCIQIYVYTAFAAVPMAFLVSESSRSMATGFLKRYIALLFSGVLMALLFVMFGAIVGSVGTTSVTPDTWEHGVQFLGELLMSTATSIAFAWCLFKSGAWARDFVGV